MNRKQETIKYDNNRNRHTVNIPTCFVLGFPGPSTLIFVQCPVVHPPKRPALICHGKCYGKCHGMCMAYVMAYALADAMAYSMACAMAYAMAHALAYAMAQAMAHAKAYAMHGTCLGI